MTKQRKTIKKDNIKDNHDNNNSNSNSSSTLDDVNNKGEVFQSIDKIFNEFNKQQEESNSRAPHKIWDNYWVKKIIRLIEITFWISLGLGTAYKTDLVNNILYSNDIDRTYFNIGVGGLVGFIIIYVYCAYFSKVDTKKSDDDWGKLHPKAIPFATICLLIFTFGIIIGCWKVWSFFTPLLLFIYFASISYII